MPRDGWSVQGAKLLEKPLRVYKKRREVIKEEEEEPLAEVLAPQREEH